MNCPIGGIVHLYNFAFELLNYLKPFLLVVLGDKYLKPEVISDPEIKVVERTAEDEFIILASDGLWDVLSNELACDVARRCFEEADPAREIAPLHTGIDLNVTGDEEEENPESEANCHLAAALLARLALGRKSSDNISVIVVDLRRV